MPRRLRPALLAVALLFSAGAAAEGPKDPTNDPMLMTAGFLTHHQDIQYRLLGLDAYNRKAFADAFSFFRRAAFFADKPSQGMVAEMYWNGEGVPRDRALAYVWMDLAAERGYLGFLGLRETYWAALTPAERERALQQGQAIYARFGDEAAKPRYEFQLRVGRREMTGSRTGFNRGVSIEIPGPEGGQSIPGNRFYDDRYWDAKKYWAWQDKVWMRPRIGKVTLGELQDVQKATPSRVPHVAPETGAAAPEVPEAPTPRP